MKKAIQHLIDDAKTNKPVSEDPGDFIQGAAQVVEYYGIWPTFHDADYVAIHIDMNGPTVSINFRLYDWDEAADGANRPNIVLLWREVEELNLSGIQELGQNAIGRMEITQMDDGIMTLIQPTWDGTTAGFRAKSVEVTHFDPHKEWDYETRNTASD